ncbi:ABC transporter permease [Nonomuraea endophytica]|uniref:Peptide/nickel transport system permease protein n=1 Tax=Nonomuraea endophytica TaxID=714136 RepID=A0A7W8EG39_9ACTN|nr:ABC transporter permease [Nonomuraea endophytica]MBB5079450.1 peptide/nickel transport system permease protein [Nonomuraea endophytica]
MTAAELTPWQLARRRFLRHRLAVAGLAVLVLLLVGCFGADLIAPYERGAQNLLLGPVPPSAAHWFGTDELGRDYLTELLYAGRISLAIGLCVALLATVVGTALGAAAGFFGGWADEIIMRITDLFIVLPAIVVLAVVLQGAGRSPVVIVPVLAAIGWTTVARIVRGQVLSLREKEYIAAATVLGVTKWRIIVRHILPNLTGVIAVSTSLGAASAVIVESTLSFLGYGVQPPESSWGNLLSQASGLIGTGKVYLLYFPGLFILLTALAINFLGDGLRDAFDPKGARP